MSPSPPADIERDEDKVVGTGETTTSIIVVRAVPGDGLGRLAGPGTR